MMSNCSSFPFSIRVHVIMFNFHVSLQGFILSTNQSRLIFPQRLLDRRSRKNVGPRGNRLAKICRLYYEPKLWKQVINEKISKKSICALLKSHLFYLLVVFHHLPLKNSLEKKTLPPMRLAKIQQPHPSQQPRIVAHAQQGGDFGRAEKSHCYSHWTT